MTETLQQSEQIETTQTAESRLDIDTSELYERHIEPEYLEHAQSDMLLRAEAARAIPPDAFEQYTTTVRDIEAQLLQSFHTLDGVVTMKQTLQQNKGEISNVELQSEIVHCTAVVYQRFATGITEQPEVKRLFAEHHNNLSQLIVTDAKLFMPIISARIQDIALAIILDK